MGEIKAGFQIGQEFQKHVAQLVQSTCQAAGQLSGRHLQLARIGGLDHAQHGLGLGKIDAAA